MKHRHEISLESKKSIFSVKYCLSYLNLQFIRLMMDKQSYFRLLFCYQIHFPALMPMSNPTCAYQNNTKIKIIKLKGAAGVSRLRDLRLL